MSSPLCQALYMNAARYFMPREDYEPPTTHLDNPFMLFGVYCLKCKSRKLKVRSEHDDDTGEIKVYLFCSSCLRSERMSIC